MSDPLRRAPASALLTGDDLACVAWQLGRTPHPVARVAARCPWGMPSVVECLPATEAGAPFPTLYYCTCPTLVSAVAALESAGGVRAWSRRLTARPELLASLQAAKQATIRRRAELVAAYRLTLLDHGASLAGGVGGAGDPLHVKCLHAHVAHALACPGYELGEAMLAEVADLWCADARCRQAEHAGGPAESTIARS